MKRLATLIAITLSLLIVYSGVGVSIAHYCCARCEAVQSCCTDGCPKCQKSHAHSCDSKKDCKDDGCTATIYKVDLVKYAPELTVSVPVVTLFVEQFNSLWASAYMDRPMDTYTTFSPPPISPRQQLALHSVFII